MDTPPPLSRDERARIVLEELDDILPGGSLTRPALEELRRYFQRRLANPNPEASGSSPSPSSIVDARPIVEKVESLAAPRASFQELLAERSILIVSYVGAFLLIVATLLFEIYSGDGVSGEIRFLAVLFLDLAFGVAGIVCLRSERLRLVGRTYLAIFALMVPLVFTAAYVYLSNGISAVLVVAICGLSSSLLYGALARALQSRAYVYLSLTAFAVGWVSATNEAGLGPWRGAVLTPLIVLFAFAACRGQRIDLGHLLTEPAKQMANLISTSSEDSRTPDRQCVSGEDHQMKGPGPRLNSGTGSSLRSETGQARTSSLLLMLVSAVGFIASATQPMPSFSSASAVGTPFTSQPILA